jgi:hypothetical protein
MLRTGCVAPISVSKLCEQSTAFGNVNVGDVRDDAAIRICLAIVSARVGLEDCASLSSLARCCYPGRRFSDQSVDEDIRPRNCLDLTLTGS